MKTSFQTVSSGRVPAPPEKQFPIKKTRIIRAIIGFLLIIVAEAGVLCVTVSFDPTSIDSSDDDMVASCFIVLLAVMLRGIWKWALVDFALSFGLTGVIFFGLTVVGGGLEYIITYSLIMGLGIGVPWFLGYGLGSPLLLLRKAREVRDVGTSPPP